MDAPPPLFEPKVSPDDFHVLVVSSGFAHFGDLASRSGEFSRYRRQSTWTLASLGDVPGGDFDVSIVVSADVAELPAALSVATALARRRDTTILLAPAPIVGDETLVDDALVVAGPGTDAFANFALLVRTILAPVLTEQLVCVDWSDILTILDEGTQAMLIEGTGTSATEAIAALSSELAAAGVAKLHGLCGVLSSAQGVPMRAYHVYFDMLKAWLGSEAYIVVAAPEHYGEGASASVLAITNPTWRWRKRRSAPVQEFAPEDLPPFLRKQA